MTDLNVSGNLRVEGESTFVGATFGVQNGFVTGFLRVGALAGVGQNILQALQVDGDTDCKGAFACEGTVSCSGPGGLIVANAANVAGLLSSSSLTVTNNADIGGEIFGVACTLSNQMSCAGIINSADITVAGSGIFNGGGNSIEVANDATIAGGMNVAGTANFTNAGLGLSVSNQAFLGALNVVGTTSLSNVDVSGTTQLLGPVQCSNAGISLQVFGQTTLLDNLNGAGASFSATVICSAALGLTVPNQATIQRLVPSSVFAPEIARLGYATTQTSFATGLPTYPASQNICVSAASPENVQSTTTTRLTATANTGVDVLSAGWYDVSVSVLCTNTSGPADVFSLSYLHVADDTTVGSSAFIDVGVSSWITFTASLQLNPGDSIGAVMSSGTGTPTLTVNAYTISVRYFSDVV